MKKKQCTIGRKDIGPKEPDVLRNLTCNGRLRAAARTAQKNGDDVFNLDTYIESFR